MSDYIHLSHSFLLVSLAKVGRATEAPAHNGDKVAKLSNRDSLRSLPVEGKVDWISMMVWEPANFDRTVNGKPAPPK